MPMQNETTDNFVQETINESFNSRTSTDLEVILRALKNIGINWIDTFEEFRKFLIEMGLGDDYLVAVMEASCDNKEIDVYRTTAERRH